MVRSPSFARLLVARGVSLVGDGIGGLALVVHVQRAEGTGTAVALLLLVSALPRLLSPFTGVVADRVDQRTVLVVGELAQGALIGIAAVWLPDLPLLLVLLVAKSTIATIVEPAGHSAVPALVEDVDLPVANSLLGGLRQAGDVLGPLIGGILVAAVSVRAGLAVDALTFLLSVPLLMRIPALAPEITDGPGRSSIGASAWEGIRYLTGQPVARAVTVGFFIVGLGAADDVALPFLARTLGGGERAIGVLYASVGAGLLLGYVGLLVARDESRIGPGSGFVAGAAVAALGNVLTGVSPVLGLAVGFQIVRGLGIALLETTLQTLVQRSVPRRVLGRVFANIYGAVNIAAALSLLAGGMLLDATSPRTVLVVVGVLGLVGAAATRLLLRVQRGEP